MTTAILRSATRVRRFRRRCDGHLFDSMVSVRAGADAAEPHLGLGLYIVRLIAQFHGGRADARNLPDNAGVVVTVALPMP